MNDTLTIEDFNRAVDLLKRQDEAPEIDWPRNSKGYPKLPCYPKEADRLIAIGLVEEDDIIRIGMIPGDGA